MLLDRCDRRLDVLFRVSWVLIYVGQIYGVGALFLDIARPSRAGQSPLLEPA